MCVRVCVCVCVYSVFELLKKTSFIYKYKL